MDKKELKEKIEQGYLLSRAIIEVVGKPKEHVENAINQLAEHIKNDKEIKVITEHKEETTEQDKEKGLWATFVELELLVKGFPKLMDFCFDYMPSSVEILEPEEFKFKSREMAGFLNDMQMKLHNLGVMIKNLKTENIFLKQNTANLLMNTLLMLVTNTKRNLDNLSKLTGISAEELKPFIEHLLKEGKIKESEGAYTLAK